MDPIGEHPFPDPVSPWIRMGLSLLTTGRINSSRRRIDELSPRNGLSRSRLAFDGRTRNCCRKRLFSIARTSSVCNDGELHGLRQKLLCAFFDRPNGQFDRALWRQHDDGNICIGTLEVFQ